ncbi:glutathione transferase GstA [Entomomonas sp. E2T0]|uniref:glutathione transferase GstA n=1 Tax=Entomomonas sp. E2T0 TaxID=2930213 RepID=UPI0022281413|nr:glutathione transferase GstA [Entomomonas sp. E2T0]UYZ85031.1 glutathione transferase GstA [Entomomonas sp. E2T0]
MKLFYAPGACSLSPHMVLCEAGVHFDLERVDLATKKTEQGDDYLKVNPKGQVPALLLDNGNLLTEGAVIVQYIANHASSKHLMPPQTDFKYYEALEWLNYIATELHKGFSPLFNPKFPEDLKQATRKQLEKKLAYVDSQLNHKDFLLGEQINVADFYLYTILTWAKKMNLEMASLANLTHFIKNMEERPSVKTALAAEKK